MKNYGLIIDSIDKRDYPFLGSEEALKSWAEHLPTKEIQVGLYDDTKSCVTFAITNQIETTLPHNQWLEDNGYYDENGKVNFSDRFTAVWNN